jgi:phage tail-like protein
MANEMRSNTGAFFKVEIQDAVIGHFAMCHGLEFAWEITTYSEGGLNTFQHHFRDRIAYPNLVLTRGLTNDEALAKWCLQTTKPENRGHVIVSLLKRNSAPLRRWSFARAFPVKWTGPELDAKGHIVMERLEIQHEGMLPT